MAKNPDAPKKPGKDRRNSKAPNSKASRPEVQPIGPALAELLNPAINRGESGIGSVHRIAAAAGQFLGPPRRRRSRRASRAGVDAGHAAMMWRSGMREGSTSRAAPSPNPLPQAGEGSRRLAPGADERNARCATCVPSPASGRGLEAAGAGARTKEILLRKRNLRPLSRLRGRARVGVPPQTPASTKPRRPITAPRPRFPTLDPELARQLGLPPRRKMTRRWRARRATRWRRSASRPPPRRWKT